MFKKNIKPILMAGALALATAVSPVLADDYTTDTTGNKYIPNSTSTFAVDVNKELTFEEGVTTTVSKTFQISVSDAVLSEDTDVGSTPPTVKINELEGNSDDCLTVSNSDLDNNSNKGNLKIYFNATNSDPGTYTYTVTESADESNATNVDMDNVNSYKVTLRVVNANGLNPGNSVIIDQVVIQPAITNTDNSTKVESIDFKNNYYENATINLKKEVEGQGAQTDDKFGFTIHLTIPQGNKDYSGSYNFQTTGNLPESETDVTNKVSGTNSVTGKISFDSKPYTKDISVFLKDDETVTISDLPVGTTYYITETNDGGYNKTEYTLNNASSRTKSKNTPENAKLTSDGASVVFINTKNATTPLTGVIINNMPYIALLGASGAGLVVLAASKKRSKK